MQAMLRWMTMTGMFAAVLLAQAPPVVPDSNALIKEVEAHQRTLDEIRESYTFHEVMDTDTLDSKGVVTGRTSDEREVFFVNRHRIARLLKKDGKALTGKDEKNEQERVQKATEKATKTPLDHDSFREGGDLELSKILAVMNISHPRRVTVNGRATLAFDFTGDRHASAHGVALSAARKMSGTVWVDEADKQVARLEATLDDNFRLGGGLLATVQKGTFLKLEQSYVGQGLWLPSTSEVHVVARELVVKGLRENVHVRDFDFRRFDVAVGQKIGEPAH